VTNPGSAGGIRKEAIVETAAIVMNGVEDSEILLSSQKDGGDNNKITTIMTSRLP